MTETARRPVPLVHLRRACRFLRGIFWRATIFRTPAAGTCWGAHATHFQRAEASKRAGISALPIALLIATSREAMTWLRCAPWSSQAILEAGARPPSNDNCGYSSFNQCGAAICRQIIAISYRGRWGLLPHWPGRNAVEVVCLLLSL